jgi:hypothetical protein
MAVHTVRKLLNFQHTSTFMRCFVFLLICLCAAPAFAASEKSYAETWAAANKGTLNVRMRDGTRCDVLTAKHAVEVAFAAQWQDAIGRALYQASQLNKHPGIVLIVEDAKDAVYRQRLDTTITVFNLPIDVWEVGSAATK